MASLFPDACVMYKPETIIQSTSWFQCMLQLILIWRWDASWDIPGWQLAPWQLAPWQLADHAGYYYEILSAYLHVIMTLHQEHMPTLHIDILLLLISLPSPVVWWQLSLALFRCAVVKSYFLLHMLCSHWLTDPYSYYESWEWQIICKAKSPILLLCTGGLPTYTYYTQYNLCP